MKSRLTLSEKCSKYFLLTTCGLLFMAGLSLFSVSMWIVVDATDFLRKLDSTVAWGDSGKISSHVDDFAMTQIRRTAITFLAFSVFTTLLGFFGCCGAWREWRCFVGIFSSILLVLLMAIVGVAIFHFVTYGSDINAFVLDVYETSELIERRSQTSGDLTQLLEQLSMRRCCGGTEPEPDRCATNSYTCVMWLSDVLKMFVMPLSIFGVIVIVLMLIGVFVSCCLFCALNRRSM